MNRELLKICGISLFHFMAIDLITPLVPQYANNLSLAPALIGVLVSLNAFVPFVLALPGGMLTDRFGTRRILVMGVGGVVSAGALFALSRGVPGLFAAEILVGLAHFFVMVSIQAHVSLLAVNRDQGFGYFTFFSALGTTVGPIVGGFVAAHIGFEQAFAVAATSASLAFLLSSSLREARTEANGKRVPLKEHGRHIRGFIGNRGIVMAMFASFAMLSAMALVASYYPLYLQTRGFSPASIGLLIGSQAAAATTVRLLMFWAIQRWGRRRLLGAALLMGTIGVGLVPLMPSFALLALAAVILGMGKGLSQPLSMIIVANSTSDDERGLAMGFRIMGNRLGSFLSPLVFGALVLYLPLQALFYVTAAVPLVAFMSVRSWVRQESGYVAPAVRQSQA